MRRMDNSFQCCIKDGRRPTAYVVQTKYANHLKVLYSKDMVLNVQAKGFCPARFSFIALCVGEGNLASSFEVLRQFFKMNWGKFFSLVLHIITGTAVFIVLPMFNQSPFSPYRI